MGTIKIQASQPASTKITPPLALIRSLWRNVWCWWWRFWRWGHLYAIIQMHISSWYWYITPSRRIITIWDMQRRWISGTNIPWYIIYPFWTLPLFSYLMLKCQFLFSGTEFRFIHTNIIQRREIIYQFTILYKLFLNITIYILLKKLITNIIIGHFIFPSTTKCLKKKSNITFYFVERYNQ